MRYVKTNIKNYRKTAVTSPTVKIKKNDVDEKHHPRKIIDMKLLVIQTFIQLFDFLIPLFKKHFKFLLPI